MTILLNAKRITGLLSAIVVCLLLAHAAGQFLIFYFGYNYNSRLVTFFDLNGEGNIPALFSTVALMSCSLLFAVIACAKRADGVPYALHWRGLAIVFLYLSVDEALALHENLIRPMRHAFGTSGGWFLYGWVIPYGVCLVVFSLLYLKFWMHLPRKTRRSFAIAAVVYVSGAIGFEMLEGLHVTMYGMKNITFTVLITFEEMFEMTGIVVLIDALISYIMSAGAGEVHIKITSRYDSSPFNKATVTRKLAAEHSRLEQDV